MKNEPYRIAIVGRTGKGNYGHALDIEWIGVPNTQIVGVADEDPKGREEAAKRLNINETYADYRELFDKQKPDVVSICARWLDQHAEICLAAAERGIHILVEKPFCRNLEEADAVVAACEMRHVKLAIAHPTTYSPAVPMLRKLLAEGAIGQVLELRARGKEDRRGGGEDIWVLGSHMLDLILTLGYQPEWCFGSVLTEGRPIGKDDVHEGGEGIGPLAGDAVRALYGLKGGITATFQSYRNAGLAATRYGMQIVGSKGMIDVAEGVFPPIWILQDPTWNNGRSGKAWKKVSSRGIGVEESPELLKDPKYSKRNQLAMEDLLAAIGTPKTPLCSMYQGRNVVEMIAAVFESQRLARPVTFPMENRKNPLTML